MGIGIGVSLIFIIISLVIAWKHSSHRLGQAVYYIFVGLILASIAPGIAQGAHNFLTGTTNSVQHIDTKK